MPFITDTLGVATLAGLIAASAPVLALEEHEDISIRYDADLSLSSVLETTLQRHPQAGRLSARAARAEAENGYAQRWFPEASELSAFHMSDRAFDDIGAYENEVALSFPMWLPGEKKAQTGLGKVLSDAKASNERAFRWRVSAQLRQLLWQIKASGRQWELAVEQENRLNDLLSQINIFTEAGDLARADQLATLQELARWKAETLKLEAEYQDAARAYIAVTSLNVVPANLEEKLNETQQVQAAHPALQVAMDRVEEESASHNLARERNTVRPSLDVFWREFRGDRSGLDVNALGIGFSLPLGKSPRQSVDVARANEDLSRAESELLQTRRELDLQLHEARHLLHTTRLQLQNSFVMVETATERFRLDQLSFELGEISTQEWLRRLSQFKDIEQSHELLLIQEGAAIAAYNQAVGETL